MDFKKFYDEQPDYDSFRNDPRKREYYEAASDWKVRNLVSLVPGDKSFATILEVGCAFGILLNNLAGRLKIGSVTGVDISSENISTAVSMWPRCSLFRGTLTEFMNSRASNAGKFDLVVLSDIVEHIPDDLNFMIEAGKAGSYILLNLPLEKSFSTRNRNYGETDPSGHLRSYDRQLAEKLIKNAGLETISAFTSIAFFDKDFYKAYSKNRSVRLNKKPFPLRVFWKSFYFFHDRLRLSSEKISARIWGSNYFALLRSSSS
jgi:SAM-dependent methyltransferase